MARGGYGAHRILPSLRLDGRASPLFGFSDGTALHALGPVRLCVSLYEALFGHRPFSGRSVRELSFATRRGEILAPRADHDVPGWVRSAIVRGLSADPDDRWPSMNALLRNLDPEARRRRRSTVFGAGLALSVAAGAMGMHARTAAQPPCRNAGAPIAEAWDDDTRREMKERMLATDLPYANQTWTRVGVALDDYAAQWTAARSETCTDIDAGSASPTVDLQIQCLDERLTTFTALVDVLEQADADTVRNATRAVSKLPSIGRCLDDEALVATVAPPSNRQTALAVDAVRAKLAAIRALELAGHYAEAHERIEKAVAAAKDTDPVAPPSLGVLKTVFFWADSFTLKEHLQLVLTVNVLFWAVLLGWFRTRSEAWDWARKTALIALLIVLSAAVVRIHQSPYADSGVVLAERIDVKSASGKENVTLFQLHEGAIITLSEEKNGWVRIALTPDKTGWVPRESIGT